MAKAYVSNPTELATAVANMSVNEIILTADIEMINPIDIPPTKAELIFDGTHEGITYRLTDIDSNDLSQTLAVRSSSSIQLTFQNMHMTGRNFYGIPCIYDFLTSGVSVTYRNITYIGPQLVHNLAGTTHFDTCDITIVPSSASLAHEVGEVTRVDFAGNNIIRHDASATPSKAVFWFRYTGAYFRVLEGAKLTVTTTNYFMYNAILGIANPVPFEIQSGASFTLHARQGISENSLHPAESFLVGTNASFHYVQEESSGEHSLYLNGNFTVNEGASVYMQADYDANYSLIHFANNSNNALTVTNPKSFVLYHSAYAPIDMPYLSTNSRGFSILSEQLNHWTAALPLPQAGTFEDTPQNYWHNSGWETFTTHGTFRWNSTDASASGLVNPPIPISNFNFQNARVISAGSITIEPDPIIDSGRPITGRTEPGAKLIIRYAVDGEDYEFKDIVAGPDGRFEVDTEMQIPIDTEISISANTPFLIKTITDTVVWAGEVTIKRAPVTIEFETPPLSTNPLLLRRKDGDMEVIVNDNRPYISGWELKASVSGPLMEPGGEVLENAVVFKDTDDTLLDISETPVTVYTGEPAEGDTIIPWEEGEGILVRVEDSIRSGARYTTQLIWSLEVIPEP